MHNYILSLGSNIHPKLDYLRSSLIRLEKFGVITDKSSIYLSEPWGKKQQSDFYNAVIRFESTYDPDSLLKIIKSIESEMGRMNNGRWAERIIDIDILFADDLQIASKKLRIPHQYIMKRRFVLEPLVEITGTTQLPYFSKTAFEMLSECVDISRVKKLSESW